MIEFRSFEALLEAAHEYPPLPIAIVDATEEFVLEGAVQAAEAGLISPILIGNEQVIRSLVPEFPGAEAFPIVANATLAGIVLGAQVPIVLTSRSDPPRARLVSAALASLMYNRTKS